MTAFNLPFSNLQLWYFSGESWGTATNLRSCKYFSNSSVLWNS